MITDPIANYLTRLRNAVQARRSSITSPTSGVINAITAILLDQGYIRDYQVVKTQPQDMIKVLLKYEHYTKESPLKSIKRISTPGLRKYVTARELLHKHVLNGLGIAIISTSQGIITDKEARRKNIGGEELCQIY